MFSSLISFYHLFLVGVAVSIVSLDKNFENCCFLSSFVAVGGVIDYSWLCCLSLSMFHFHFRVSDTDDFETPFKIFNFRIVIDIVFYVSFIILYISFQSFYWVLPLGLLLSCGKSVLFDVYGTHCLWLMFSSLCLFVIGSCYSIAIVYRNKDCSDDFTCVCRPSCTSVILKI